MPLGAHKAAIMGVAGVSTGDVVLLSSQDADEDSVISFTSGIDSTYGEYIFKFYNIHPSNTSGPEFQFQVNASGESGYNEAITSTAFYAYIQEDDGGTPALTYNDGMDQDNDDVAFQTIIQNIGADADESGAGELHLFNPASTTYAKHFYSRSDVVTHETGPVNYQFHTGGYINTTAAITNVQFKLNAGNIDTGTIKMWGVK